MQSMQPILSNWHFVVRWLLLPTAKCQVPSANCQRLQATNKGDIFICFISLNLKKTFRGIPPFQMPRVNRLEARGHSHYVPTQDKNYKNWHKPQAAQQGARKNEDDDRRSTIDDLR